jgi:hypothetical protein
VVANREVRQAPDLPHADLQPLGRLRGQVAENAQSRSSAEDILIVAADSVTFHMIVRV